MDVGTCVLCRVFLPCGPRGDLGAGRGFIKGLSLRFCLSCCVSEEWEMCIILGAVRSGSWVGLCEF